MKWNHDDEGQMLMFSALLRVVGLISREMESEMDDIVYAYVDEKERW